MRCEGFDGNIGSGHRWRVNNRRMKSAVVSALCCASGQSLTGGVFNTVQLEHCPSTRSQASARRPTECDGADIVWLDTQHGHCRDGVSGGASSLRQTLSMPEGRGAGPLTRRYSTSPKIVTADFSNPPSSKKASANAPPARRSLIVAVSTGVARAAALLRA